MRKSFKKIVAVAMAATMVLGSSVVAFAEDPTSGTVDGNGDFEGHVDKIVTSVTLPTATASTFAYKMDPEGLIAATSGAKYEDTTFEAGKNVFFLSSEGTYTADSAKLKVINKGTKDVDVTVSAKTEANTNVAMADSATFADTDTAAKLYLGLKVADQAAVAVKTDDTGKVTVGLKGRPSNYEIQLDDDDNYVYGIKENVADKNWNSFEFGLTGACNPKGDYSATGLAASKVTVTWSFIPHPDTNGAAMLTETADDEITAPNVAPTFTASDETPGLITVTAGTGTLALSEIKSIKVIGYDNATYYDIYNELSGAWADATTTSSSIQITSAALAGFDQYDTKEVTITYENAAEEEKTATVSLLFK